MCRLNAQGIRLFFDSDRVDDAAGASAVEGREGAGEEKTEEAGDDPEPMEL